MRRVLAWPLLLDCAPASETAPIQAADLASLVRAAPAGSVLRLPPGQLFRLSSPLVITRSIVIDGRGARVIAADGAGMTGAMIRSDGVDGVTLLNLLVDANVKGRGADYGIWITGGERHRIAHTRVRNTSQACVLLQDAAGVIEDNMLDGCGRDLTMSGGTAANNHGVMLAALTRDVAGVLIRRNVVSRSYRKGVTTYSRGSGRLSGIVISDNEVSSCGLGGIYVANAPGASPQRDIVLSGNRVRESYVGFQIDGVERLTMTDNRSDSSRDRSGRPGAQGLVLNDVSGAAVTRMTVVDSGGSGITIRGSSRVAIVAPVVINANAGRQGFAAGIHFSDVHDSRAEGVTVIDDRRPPATTHGLVENDGSGANAVTIKKIEGPAQRLLRVASN